MSPTPPVMGFSYTQGEWIVLLTRLPLPCPFFGAEKRIMNWQRAAKPFYDAGLAVF